ncbi:hypothetical protein GRI58_11130 [Porphyrobacter algicida]|uniref:Porin n=1 Tax=Qipengyuania algicida TaxID=1836209 RepID=A0A845AKJ2_9SPHN|nr:hypothetical protein [Qipengyuania algicida]MXP29375.1 hypothetical protein [Qipengyuania algicida]
MSKKGSKSSAMRVIPALLAAAGLAFALPSVSGAVVSKNAQPASRLGLDYVPFTPAKVDPRLARVVEQALGTDGLRFTPAARPENGDRVVTMAVRVDRATAKAISFRAPMDGADNARPGLGTTPLVAPTRFNLGTARGYQSFAQPTAKLAPLQPGTRDIGLPDMSQFKLDEGAEASKPSRLQPRIAFKRDNEPGHGPRAYDSDIDQLVDLGGAYRITRNLDVTAGVRMSQQRDRIAPLTDGVEDSKAIYVGTQFHF